jgi:hypothetical protein
LLPGGDVTGIVTEREAIIYSHSWIGEDLGVGLWRAFLFFFFFLIFTFVE